MNSTVRQANCVRRKSRRWLKRLKWVSVGVTILFLVALFVIRNHLRTLTSLRRVAGTNAFVMDYYVDYNPDQIRKQGLDLNDLEGSYIRILLPSFAVPIADRVKRAYLPTKVEPIPESKLGHFCSTLCVCSGRDDTFLGRNFDSPNDAFLILRVHDNEGLASISVIDIAYLNLNRADLDKTSLIERIPLLFTPYYLMDGMNRHGVAVSSMSVPFATPQVFRDKPTITQATLMRMILDYAKTADEAVSLVREFSVHFVGHPEHLMVADGTGNSRVIEFIDGEIKVIAMESHWQVCTNETIWQSSEQERDDVCHRYRAGSEAAEQMPEKFGLEEVEDAIRTMSVDNWTMWTSVYDMTHREIRVFYKAKREHEFRDKLPMEKQRTKP